MALLAGILFSVSSIIVSAYGAIDWTLWVTSQGYGCVVLGKWFLVAFARLSHDGLFLFWVTSFDC